MTSSISDDPPVFSGETDLLETMATRRDYGACAG